MRTSSQLSRRRGRSRRMMIIVATTVVVVLGLTVVFANGDRSNEATAPDVTLSYFDGTSESLGDLVGQPVVLNFWASWCPACVSEMPAFGEVHRRLGDRVKFVGINMQEVDLDAALELVETTDVDYQLAHDPTGAIYRRFGGLAMPTTVFISAEGSVAQVYSGTLTENGLVALIERELLG